MLKDMAQIWIVRKYDLEEDYNRLKSAKRYKISWISNVEPYWIYKYEVKWKMFWNSYKLLNDDTIWKTENDRKIEI